MWGRRPQACDPGDFCNSRMNPAVVHIDLRINLNASKLALCVHVDGGRHLEKSKNRHILAAVRAISTKFGTVTQFDFLDRSDCKINLVEKLQI